MFKHTAVGIAFTVLALTIPAVPALAQQPNTAQQSSSGQNASGFVQGGSAGGWRASKLIGASVYGPDNASIGEISDVLIAPDGKIRAVVVSVGGFLGAADKDVAIPFQALSITRGPAAGAVDKIKADYSKQQLNDAPRFAYDQPANATTGQGGTGGIGGIGGIGGAPSTPAPR
jgi:sporulation protein YlmC with PRC-barrel domain